MNRWVVPDPWRYRLRSWFMRNVWCRLVGHDDVIKMDGTRLCRRH